MPDPYLIVKWAHVLGATILFGTGLGIAYFQWMAWRSGDGAVFAGVSRLVVRADWTFTLTAGLIQPVTGAALVLLGGYDPFADWLIWTYALYALAFACWLPVVVLQLGVAREAAAAFAAGEPPPPVTGRRMWAWFALGWPAFIALLLVFWLMIAKAPPWA